MGKHNVVIAHFPAGRMGTNDAAATAARMQSIFTSLRFSLMVGIAGGVPSDEADIRLGDVVISQPHGQHNGVVQYDFGKILAGGHESRTGNLRGPPDLLLNTLTKMRASLYCEMNGLDSPLSKFRQHPNFQRPSLDLLFKPQYNHIDEEKTCEDCDTNMIVQRATRIYKEISIHYGTVASGNRVIKDGLTRDELNRRLGGVLCFEMEAAGLMNCLSCLVIRGICDYADSHKNKDWQPYASATAASCANELLKHVPASESSKFSEEEQKQIHERLLSSLWFPEMNSRENSIKNGSRDTMKWIFQKGKANKTKFQGIRELEIQVDTPACEFVEWLETEGPIFWISGNPGSGKSTLMKYLTEEHQTSIHLSKWSSSIMIYKFFFIETGLSPLQRQLKGCLRALLYQIFDSDDFLMYDNLRISPKLGQKVSEHDWSVEELELIITKVLTVQPGVCIFLDGLDEIDTQSDERLQVTRFIRSLGALPNVKICASSRPENFFQHTMESYPSVRVQYLNHAAIAAYVEAELEPYQNNIGSKINTLTRDLVIKSNGVFLWVALALRSLIRGIVNGDSAKTLQQRIMQLAPDLYGLYQQIWTRHSVDLSLYKWETAEIFWYALNIPTALPSWGYPLRHPISYILATHESLRGQILSSISQGNYSKEFEERMIQEYTKWLCPRTGGLLECKGQAVDFVHRSAIEFLKNTKEGQNILASDTRPHKSKWLNLLNACMLKSHAWRHARLGESRILRETVREWVDPKQDTRMHRLSFKMVQKLKDELNNWAGFIDMVVPVAIAGYINDEEELKWLKDYQTFMLTHNQLASNKDLILVAGASGSPVYISEHAKAIRQMPLQDRSMILIGALYGHGHSVIFPDYYFYDHVVFESVALQENRMFHELGSRYYYDKKRFERLVHVTRSLASFHSNLNHQVKTDLFNWVENTSPATLITMTAFQSVFSLKLMIQKFSGGGAIAPNERETQIHALKSVLKKKLSGIRELGKLVGENGCNRDQEIVVAIHLEEGKVHCDPVRMRVYQSGAFFAVKRDFFVSYFKMLKDPIVDLGNFSLEANKEELCKVNEREINSIFGEGNNDWQLENLHLVRCLSLGKFLERYWIF